MNARLALFPTSPECPIQPVFLPFPQSLPMTTLEMKSAVKLRKATKKVFSLLFCGEGLY